MRQLNLGSGTDYRDEYVNLERYHESTHHQGRTKKPDVLGDAHCLPFDSCVFDRVVARHVIEHLEYPLGALEECFRVLQHGGVLVCEVPDPKCVDEERGDHLYSWTESTLVSIHEKSGFGCVEYSRAGLAWNHLVTATKTEC